ncbi:mitochondrial alanine aminotransferase (alanine transaminase) [Andalucia godoyi]|uniref:Mitochondrial alanine aminotransferase (Alanine transaminase) n=1 Tax=Andalucia godoyi TaxID=505711 RepID=A0A8K0AIP5_ANDGO|nr:mitochondrial alanine aminotransferase (alanine transaminase) [Andalucia godoyi]|eukprot:ANDGO_06911.mRNA.1 mitochondrial alanine aminotransferase (alanine transaminase)
MLTRRMLSSAAHVAKNTPDHGRVLTVDKLSPAILNAEYAVRGELVIRAGKLESEGRKIIYCNIGNPHQLGQKPITFFRQVLAATQYPELISSSGLAEDAKARAAEYLANIPGGTGAYSHSQGIPIVRKQVADFITARDKVAAKADPEEIFLTDGASPGIQRVLSLLIDPTLPFSSKAATGKARKHGILIPIPQYPLYSASITLLGGAQVGYELDEERGWELSIDSMKKQVTAARAQGIEPRAIVVINPGNPTGQCLSAQNVAEVINFAEQEGLVVLADEVYQVNTYRADRPFVSFKAEAVKNKSHVELFSFHSVSKGVLGECGRRGGYFECYNIDGAVKEQLYKLASVSLCSNVDGQIMTGLMVQPPKKGDPSFAQYNAEVSELYASLARRAKTLTAALDGLHGMSCNFTEGALYAFPQVMLPAKAVAAAKAAGKNPDTFYCLQMLEETGICVVPGSGFGQKNGTFHFRTTILPQESVMSQVVEKIANFHNSFIKKYE